MMDREAYKDAKKTLSQIRHILDTEPLTAQHREKLQLHAASLAGLLHRPWLPVSWSRRAIMAGIVLLGVQQAWWVENYEPLLWWLLLPFFSPRITAEAALAGRVARVLSRPFHRNGQTSSSAVRNALTRDCRDADQAGLLTSSVAGQRPSQRASLPPKSLIKTVLPARHRRAQ